MKTTVITNTNKQPLTLSVSLADLGVARDDLGEYAAPVQWMEEHTAGVGAGQTLVKQRPDRIDLMLGSSLDTPDKSSGVPLGSTEIPTALLRALLKNPGNANLFRGKSPRINVGERLNVDALLN